MFSTPPHVGAIKWVVGAKQLRVTLNRWEERLFEDQDDDDYEDDWLDPNESKIAILNLVRRVPMQPETGFQPA
jgi:hypothetical protein